MALRVLKLRRPDVCVVCGCALSVGAEGLWDSTTRTVTCLGCREAVTETPEASMPHQLDRGHAGASVGREHERRQHNREMRTREAHPWIGDLLLTLRAPPQHEVAFRRGELGEKIVAGALEQRTAEGTAIILHDRRMPGGRGNIDHLAVTSTGVFVIDAKNYKGKVEVANPLFRAPKLLIARRNRTHLIDGLDRQVAAVRGALGADHADLPVQGVLCFAHADLPLVRTLKIRGHLLLYPKGLARRLNASGPLSATAIDTLAHALAAALPSA